MIILSQHLYDSQIYIKATVKSSTKKCKWYDLKYKGFRFCRFIFSFLFLNIFVYNLPLLWVSLMKRTNYQRIPCEHG